MSCLWTIFTPSFSLTKISVAFLLRISSGPKLNPSSCGGGEEEEEEAEEEGGGGEEEEGGGGCGCGCETRSEGEEVE